MKIEKITKPMLFAKNDTYIFECYKAEMFNYKVNLYFNNVDDAITYLQKIKELEVQANHD